MKRSRKHARRRARERRIAERRRQHRIIAEFVFEIFMLCCLACCFYFVIKVDVFAKQDNTDVSKSEFEVVDVKQTEMPKKEESVQKVSDIDSYEDDYEYIACEELIAEHSISNSKSSEARNNNMAVAARIINGMSAGYILNPGDEFSWLSIVGNTTPEKGFKEAGVIVNKKSAKGYGGGVCQVSSTINSAIQAAGITPENIHCQVHSLKSSYINKDRGDKEATVSYDSKVDFSFINSLDSPIRINVTTDGGTVIAKIFKLYYVRVKKV